MTTGRINQVTVLSGKAEAEPRPRRVELFTDKRRPKRTAAARSRRDESRGPLTTIQLPPLSSPQGRPLHEQFSAERVPTVQHTPRKRRIPSTGHARGGYLLGLTPELLLISLAIGQLSTGSISARQQADGTSDASSGPG